MGKPNWGEIGYSIVNPFKGVKPDFDYIIDACDDINAKVLLVKFAVNNGIKIISSCGMGNRLCPELVYLTNIWKK